MEDAQTISTNITLIVVALLATTLVVLVPTWNRFMTYRKQTPAESFRRGVIAPSGILVGIPLLFIAAVNFSLLISVETWYYELPYIWLLMLAALTVPSCLYLLFQWIWRVIRRNPGRTESKQPDFTKEIGTASALGCFCITTLLALFITIAAVPVAIGVSIGGQSQQDDFEFARALFICIPLTLASGISCLGFSYIAELREQRTD